MNPDRSTSSEITPDLSAVLADLLTKYGFQLNTSYDKWSARAGKGRMKTWNNNWTEIFIYEDNSIGLRHNASECEKDLHATNPNFIPDLEAWLKQKGFNA